MGGGTPFHPVELCDYVSDTGNHGEAEYRENQQGNEDFYEGKPAFAAPGTLGVGH